MEACEPRCVNIQFFPEGLITENLGNPFVVAEKDGKSVNVDKKAAEVQLGKLTEKLAYTEAIRICEEVRDQANS